MNYRQHLEEMINRLRENPKVEIEKVEVEGGLDSGVIQRVKNEEPSLPQDLLEFYSQVSRFELIWRAKLSDASEDNDSWSGQISIVPLEDIASMTQWEEVLWFDFSGPNSPLRKLRPVDFFINEACTVLYPVPGNPTIHYHYCGEELHPTGLTFREWFDRAMNSRGLWYWIQSCTVEARNSVEVERLFEIGPQLFDDFDPSLFKPKTEEGKIDIEGDDEDNE